MDWSLKDSIREGGQGGPWGKLPVKKLLRKPSKISDLNDSPSLARMTQPDLNDDGKSNNLGKYDKKVELNNSNSSGFKLLGNLKRTL